MKGGGGGTKKHGRNKAKCERYRRLGTRRRNKSKRILKSSGQAALDAWLAEERRKQRAKT